MCARRFLIVVTILTLLAVAGAFAIFQWGSSALLSQATPKGSFEAPPPNDAPDYRSAALWVARPDMPGNPSTWLPGEVPNIRPGRAAIFFIHPTTYLQSDRWNAPSNAGGDAGFRTNLFVQSQSSAFTSAGDVWAPRYRQAAFGAFLLKSEDAQKALDLAYRDVAAAFDRFVQESGGRPIILAGHSQGALHLQRLLAERVAGKDLARRIVAAYVVGWPISTSADLPRLGLPACAAPDQSGCILSWMSFGQPGNPDLILGQWEDSKGLTGAERRQEDLLCVNPLNGTQGGAAPPQANTGTLVPTSDLKSATLAAGSVGAHCEKGLLLLDGEVPSLGPYVLPGNNYHVYDYALFWAAIRGDAWRRSEAWRQ